MARKQIRTSERMLFTWFMLAGLIFLFGPRSLTNKFQFAFTGIFHWPLTVSRNISLFARTQRAPTDVVSRREYNQLQNHLANILEQRDQERRKVEKLSGLRSRFLLEGACLVEADVTTVLAGSKSEMIINRGQKDGLKKGQFVLGDNGIAGTISDLWTHQARVMLITDPASKIAVKIAELDVGLIMQGCGNNYAKILLLPTKYQIKVGDFVYACKKPGFLAYPMITARVAKKEPDGENPLSWNITVEPACDLEKLSNVAVIIMNPQE
jgi:cell shape-determining protein MreC